MEYVVVVDQFKVRRLRGHYSQTKSRQKLASLVTLNYTRARTEKLKSRRSSRPFAPSQSATERRKEERVEKIDEGRGRGEGRDDRNARHYRRVKSFQ